MSAILKSGSMAPQTIATEVITRPSPAEDAMKALAAKVAKLEDQLAARAKEAEGLRAEVKDSFEQGKAEGRKLGKADADNGEIQRLERLEKSLAAALKSHADALQSTERLAALLARDALELLFSDPAHSDGWIRAILKAQMERIDQQSVIEIAVSAQDFSEDGIEQLKASLGTRRLVVVRDSDLKSSDCIIRQRLGEVDVGLRTQWSAVSGLLETMASTIEVLG